GSKMTGTELRTKSRQRAAMTSDELRGHIAHVLGLPLSTIEHLKCCARVSTAQTPNSCSPLLSPSRVNSAIKKFASWKTTSKRAKASARGLRTTFGTFATVWKNF